MQSLLLALGLLFLPGVWMNAPMPDGFVTAYRQDAQAGRIEERIARGETLDDWSRMVTLIRLNGAMPAEAFSESFAMALRRNCPGAVVAPRGAARLGGWMPSPDGSTVRSTRRPASRRRSSTAWSQPTARC